MKGSFHQLRTIVTIMHDKDLETVTHGFITSQLDSGSLALVTGEVQN